MKLLNNVVCQWLSILLAIIFSIVAIFVAFGIYNPKFDAEGFIVGVLSILVMLLIGWNIWSVINVDKRIEKIECEFAELRDGLQERIDKSIKLYDEVMDATFAYFHAEDSPESKLRTIMNGLSRISENNPYSKTIIELLIESAIIISEGDVEISDEERERYKNILDRLKICRTDKIWDALGIETSD